METWLDSLSDKRKSKIEDKLKSEDFVDIFGRKLGSYNFEEGLGMCGILLPNGQFLKCFDCQHSLLADLLNNNEEALGFYFTSKLHPEDTSIVSFQFSSKLIPEYKLINLYNYLGTSKENLGRRIPITMHQIYFLIENYRFLNSFQDKYLKLNLGIKTFSLNDFYSSKRLFIYEPI